MTSLCTRCQWVVCLLVLISLADSLGASAPDKIDMPPLSPDSSAAVMADTTGIHPQETVRVAREQNLRLIAQERTAIEDAQKRLQRYTASLNAQREAIAVTMQLRLNATEALLKQSAASAPGSLAADALYDRLVQELQNARGEARESLNNFRETPPVPRYRGTHTAVIPLDEAQRAALQAIAKQRHALDQDADKAARMTEDLAWYRMKANLRWADALNDLRLAHLKKLSDGKRAETLGWGRSGLAQLRREWNHLDLLLDWTVGGRKRIVDEETVTLKDPYKAGTLATQLILFVGLILLYAFARRKGRTLLDKLQGSLTELTHSPLLARRAKPFFAALTALFDEICLLIAVLIAPALIGFSAQQKPLYAAYTIMVWYAAYRLVTRAVYRGLAWKMSIAAHPLPPESANKMVRSVIWVGRYVLAVAMILTCSSALLGEGYLYHIVTRLAWIGAIPICAILMRWWRTDIADTYLRLRPEGGLAQAVHATRARWYGFFVTLAAFSVLLADAAQEILRRFLFGFEQSQRMLAYLFRKKLERASQGVSEAAAPRAALPVEVRAYFDEGPTSAEDLLIDYFPGMSSLGDEIAGWRQGGKLGAVALIGEAGCGKTTWLAQAIKRFTLPASRLVRIDHRVATAGDMLALLAEVSEAPPAHAGDAVRLGAWLRAGEPRVIILDDLHLGFLRGVDTFDGFRTFSAIMEQAGEKVFWIASLAAQPFAFLHWITRGNLIFRRFIHLPTWTEEAIGRLLDKRTTASGWQVNFEDLIVERMPGLGAEAQLISTIRDYNRLIWDMALGSPRSALRYWMHSLIPDAGSSARVRFFALPEVKTLENLGEVERFVLASVIWHERAQIGELSESLRYPPSWSRDALARLSEAGILAAADGYFRVTPLWWPEVIRYLRRKHLIGA